MPKSKKEFNIRVSLIPKPKPCDHSSEKTTLDSRINMFKIQARFLEPGTIYYTGEFFDWPHATFTTLDDAKKYMDRVVAGRLAGPLAERIEMEARLVSGEEAKAHDKIFSW